MAVRLLHFCNYFLSSFPHQAVEMFAYLNIIQSAHKKFLGLSWFAYDIDFRRRAARDPTLSWNKIHPQLYLEKFTGLSRSACFSCGGGGVICLIPALCLPLEIGQAASPVIPAKTSIGEQPASGHLAPTLAAAQSHTARSLTQPPCTAPATHGKSSKEDNHKRR